MPGLATGRPAPLLRRYGNRRPPSAALPKPAQDFTSAVRHGLQEEVVVEGLLHVTASQAGSCLERFGDIGGLSAPSLQALSSTTNLAGSANSSRVVDEAICLASPPDNPTADTENQRIMVRHVTRPVSNSGRNQDNGSNRLSRAAAAECSGIGEVMQGQLPPPERAPVLDDYTAELLEASAHVRRQRRRAVVRALRASRDSGRALLEAPGSALAGCLATLGAAARHILG